MTQQQTRDISPFITPISMHGMDGRMLRLPAPKNKTREILLIYGQHASIERMAGFALDLNTFGAVTIPDLPGLGGMDSFYSIRQKPTLDNMADYLAAFVKMRYKRKRLTIIGMSWGFVVVTRMLQRNPELAGRVDLLVSLVGLAHAEDFRFSPREFTSLKFASRFLSTALPAWVAQHVFLNRFFITALYRLVEHKHAKLRDGDAEERAKRIAYEIKLWQMNDFRTQMDNTHTMLTLNLCETQVALPLWHVAVDDDRYFDNAIVEQHLHVIYKDVTVVKSSALGHAPTIVATAEEARPFMPTKLRRALARKP